MNCCCLNKLHTLHGVVEQKRPPVSTPPPPPVEPSPPDTPPPPPRVYVGEYSGTLTGSFTRDNCQAGSRTNPVQYTKFIQATATSTVSQDKANELAKIKAETEGRPLFMAEGQAHANRVGVCELVNISRIEMELVTSVPNGGHFAYETTQNVFNLSIPMPFTTVDNHWTNRGVGQRTGRLEVNIIGNSPDSFVLTVTGNNPVVVNRDSEWRFAIYDTFGNALRLSSRHGNNDAAYRTRSIQLVRDNGRFVGSWLN